jgi:hypothetical protein
MGMIMAMRMSVMIMLSMTMGGMTMGGMAVPDGDMIMPTAVMMVRRVAMRDRRRGRGQHQLVIMLHAPLRKGRPTSAALKAVYS